MPPDRYRWVLVAAGATLGCVALGAVFSLPILLRSMSASTGWRTTGVSMAMTIAFLAMAAGSAAWGMLSDRWGARRTSVLGSVLLALGLVLASRAPTLTGFQLAFGLLVGFAAAAFLAPIMACVSGWFDTHRSLALALVSAGFGVAPMTLSPWVAALASTHEWRAVLQIVAELVLAVQLPVACLIRPPPVLGASQRAPAQAAGDAPVSSVRDLLGSPAFVLLAVTNFFCCATHSGPIIHTVSYAVTCGIPLVTAVTIYSLEGLAGLGGRIAFGLAGDRFGARRTLVAGLALQALFAAAYYFAHSLGAFYMVATLFGFTYGGVMPLYAVLAREHFPMRIMGTVIGGTTMAGGLGMATGPVLGGWLYDYFGSYGALYIAAFGFGVLATVVAAAFRPAGEDHVAAAAA